MASVDHSDISLEDKIRRENKLEKKSNSSFFGPGSRAELELNTPQQVAKALADGLYKTVDKMGEGFLRAAYLHKLTDEIENFRDLSEPIQFALLRYYRSKKESDDVALYRKEVLNQLAKDLLEYMGPTDTIITAKLVALSIVNKYEMIAPQVRQAYA